MKKNLLTILSLLSFVVCSAQVKTQSNYDVDGDGNESISDGSSTVNKVLGKVAGERVLVDGESLNALLMTIEKRLGAIEDKLGIESSDNTLIHECVDLGLPSGLKWATCNVGAKSPEDYGHYIAWAQIDPQRRYDWPYTAYLTNNSVIEYGNYKFSKYIGTTDTLYRDKTATDENALKTILDPEDDVAHMKWGGEWRMPTPEDYFELRNNCYWQWVTSYNNKSVNGYIVYKAKYPEDKAQFRSDYTPKGNYSISDTHIFLPAAGCIFEDGYQEKDARGEIFGSYWTSSVYTSLPTHALNWTFIFDQCGQGASVRYVGSPVRPVCK